MSDQPTTTISAVIAAYQAERFIAETLESVLGQTRPPDEVVVVDDGSWDGTARELERFADRIRVIRQPNGGYQNAINRAIREARCEFVALCGADDVWEPRKLEYQEQAILAHPEADLFFGHFESFGNFEAVGGQRPVTARPPGEGLLDSSELLDTLFRQDVIGTAFIAIRRDLFDRLGPFLEDCQVEDYDFWFRCLEAGVRFYYDPRQLGRHRRHDANLTNDLIGLYSAKNEIRERYAHLLDDKRVLRETMAADYFRVGRLLVDEGRPHEARKAFRQTVRSAGTTFTGTARALGWLAILALPERSREQSATAFIRVSRALSR
jgi:glycosyltransferase involved in cell wall biosynthesis